MRTSKPVVNREESDMDKEGNWICGLTTKVPLVDGEGEIVGIVGVNRAITERKKVEQALIESEERYKEMFRAAAEGIVVADVETKKFRYANPAICEMLGYTEEELLCCYYDQLLQKYPTQKAAAKAAGIGENAIKGRKRKYGAHDSKSRKRD